MEAGKVVEYFIDSEGIEIVDAEKNGKAVEFNGVLYREGENVKVIVESGESYEGLLEKVSTLKAGSNKDMKVIDESGIGHVIKYELIAEGGISKIVVE